MRRFAVLLLVAAVAAAGCGVPGARRKVRSPKRFECHRTLSPIVIDGKLDEPDWEQAQGMEDFREPGTGLPARQPTLARFLWDDRFLYVAITMEDRDITGVKTQHDDKVWEDDVAELFLKPSESSPAYYEFQVNPLGTTLDLLIARRGAGTFDRWTPWESGMKAKANIQGTVNDWRDKDRGWIVEMAIPLSAFQDASPTVQLGDRWRFAVCRYNYSVDLPGGLERTSSAPLREMDFHRFEDYDWLEFAE